MKGATRCAQRVRQAFRSLRSSLGKVTPPATGDPVTQLILGILSRDMPESKAREALDRLRSTVVDYNELRVIPPIELAELVGEYPDVRTKCEDLSRALNRIFAIEHRVLLDRLADMSKRDAAAYLDQIDGLEAYTRARIRLLGLNQHAIPLDEAMWAWARAAEAVDPKCSLAEAQLFLERQIPPDDALEFVALVRKHAWTEFASAVRKREVEAIRSIPPDRTSRNMLAQFSSQVAEPDAEFEPENDSADGGLEESDATPPGGPVAKVTKRRPASRSAKKSAPSAAKHGAPAGKPAQQPSARKRKPRATRARSA